MRGVGVLMVVRVEVETSQRLRREGGTWLMRTVREGRRRGFLSVEEEGGC